MAHEKGGVYLKLHGFHRFRPILVLSWTDFEGYGSFGPAFLEPVGFVGFTSIK